MLFTIDEEKYRVVDLSYEVAAGQDDERPFLVKRGLLADNAFKFDILKTHTHVGTHVEAPAHFFEGGKEPVEFALGAFFGHAVLLEIDAVEPDSLAVTPEAAENSIGDILREGDIVICRNNDAQSKEKGDPEALPHLTAETARWLRGKGIKMLGIDNYVRLSKDIPSGRELHDILMGADATLVEWLDHLDQLRRREFFFMALPFKVRGVDSSWARAVAIEEI